MSALLGSLLFSPPCSSHRPPHWPLHLQRCSRDARLQLLKRSHKAVFVQRTGADRAVAPKASTTESTSSSSSASINPDPAAGRSTYKPSSFQELVQDAATAAAAALDNGFTRLEVEFPCLPGGQDSYKGSSDSYVDANVQLAIVAAKILSQTRRKRIHLLVPDEGEYKRSYGMFKSTLESLQGITMGHLSEDKKSFFGSFFGGGRGEGGAKHAQSQASQQADIFIAVNASTVELLDIEVYVNEVVGDRPIIMWNMELDTLRADLGLLGFPSKDLQYRFLSEFLPVFYIRQRDYSKSVAVAPFLINYSGMLFREYPGPWQVMLRQDSGEYACVAEDTRRYNLGQAKEELMASMGLNTEEVGSAMAFLRRGYKTSTWWEDAADMEQSNNWRR